MLALGLCVAGRLENRIYEPADPEVQTLYSELVPISDRFDPAAIEVAQLDRESLRRDGEKPAAAMARAAKWITAVSGKARPVICAYPAAFDWPFLYWYLESYAAEQNPVGFSSCIDMKTMFATKAGVPFGEAGRDDLPNELRSERAHTHNALDDAIEQAEIFSKLFTWSP
jgi:hypothetical protein